MNTVEILTERLVLRLPTQDDAVEINRAMNEVWEDLQLWMSWAYEGFNTLEATRAYIEVAAQDGSLPLIALCRKSGRFALSTGLTKKSDGIYETGYWAAKDFLGKGLATEATNATIHYGFSGLDAQKILINYFEGNDKSRRIIEKLGFAKTGYTPESHARCSDGAMLGEHHYAMTDPAILPALQVEWRLRCP
ncbi:MAG: GNAT family N-acetyltransferase [Micavibrio sp.]